MKNKATLRLAKSAGRVTNIDYNAGTCRIWNGDHFEGTAVVYAVVVDDHTCFQCDFELETLTETWPEQVRAQRLLRRKNGQPVHKAHRNQLAGELVIIFGPDLSANDAIVALKRLATSIRKKGLLIGRDDAGDFVIEKTGSK